MFKSVIAIKLFMVIYGFINVNLIQSCNIDFPNPDNGISHKFDIELDKPGQNFQTLTQYEPARLYYLMVSIDDKLKWNNWRISKVYIKLNNLEMSDSPKTTGNLIFNNTESVKSIENCKTVLELDFDRRNNGLVLPEFFQFYWASPKQSINGCIKFTIILILIRGSKSTIEAKTHLVCPITPKGIDDNNDESLKEDMIDGVSANMFSDIPGRSRCQAQSRPASFGSCNIKSTAIYNMVIENKWTHLNHWKDWPGRDGYVPQLTEFLGVSHSPQFNMYHLGGQPSQAVKDVCSKSNYTQLQRQIFNSGRDILSVIIARPIVVSDNNLKRNALIAVNSSHHLVSFLSRINPSPDWCIGLSRFDLCRTSTGKCDWPTTVNFELIPWDAGIIEGSTYVGGKQEDPPNSPICPISNTWPPDNPFTVKNGQLQSLGTVTFTLVQEINKDQNKFCTTTKPTILRDEAYKSKSESSPNKDKQILPKNSVRHCKLTEWSKWSQCSRTCGKGKQTRQREFIHKQSALKRRCRKLSLKDIRTCHKPCPPELIAKNCRLRLWKDWSPCNATCSESGIRLRERDFLSDKERERCETLIPIRQVQVCRQSISRCKPKWVCHADLSVGDDCKWMNKSVKFYFDSISNQCKQFTYRGCYGNLNRFSTNKECSNFCARFMTKETRPNMAARGSRNLGCEQPVTWGIQCLVRKASYRWYFDQVHRKCYQFHYAGCQANGNNFRTRSLCEKQCLYDTYPLSQEWDASKPNFQDQDNKQAVKQNSVNSKSRPQSGKKLRRQCIYGAWSDWTQCECIGTKTAGQQDRFRIPMKNIDLCAINDLSDAGGRLSKQTRVCECARSGGTQARTAKLRGKTPDPKGNSIKQCQYTEWSSWSKCSARCGRGVRERSRKKIATGTRVGSKYIDDCQPQFPQFNDREFCFNVC